MVREATTEIKHLKFIFFAPAAEPRKRRLVQGKKTTTEKGTLTRKKNNERSIVT